MNYNLTNQTYKKNWNRKQPTFHTHNEEKEKTTATYTRRNTQKKTKRNNNRFIKTTINRHRDKSWFRHWYFNTTTNFNKFWKKFALWEDNEVKLLGITVDNSYKFDTHINNICTKANQKLSVLSKMRNILNFKQRIIIILKSFSESQFKYCPLIWMFYSRKANNKINKIHERTLRIHCWKSVEIRSYFWSVFSCIGLNTEIYSVQIQENMDQK